MQRLVCVVVVVATLFWGCAVEAEDRHGRFSGDPEGKLVGTDLFELTSNFEYFDKDGRTWRVSAGHRSDGASIPRAFWSFIGHPWGGEYRYAAIVHDYFCRRKYPDWELVHLNFYHGMLAKGVPAGKAWIMYQAVYWFGRECRWESKPLPVECRPGADYEPSKCFINEGNDSGPLQALNKENLEKFLQRALAKGYRQEIDQLKAQPEIRRILSDNQ